MAWFFKEVGDGMQASAPTNALQELFLSNRMAMAKLGQQWPDGAALFSKYDLRRNVVTLYVTAEAAWIAIEQGFSVCEKPPVADLSLLFGSQEDWGRHFPGEQPHRSRGGA